MESREGCPGGARCAEGLLRGGLPETGACHFMAGILASEQKCAQSLACNSLCATPCAQDLARHTLRARPADSAQDLRAIPCMERSPYADEPEHRRVPAAAQPLVPPATERLEMAQTAGATPGLVGDMGTAPRLQVSLSLRSAFSEGGPVCLVALYARPHSSPNRFSPRSRPGRAGLRPAPSYFRRGRAAPRASAGDDLSKGRPRWVASAWMSGPILPCRAWTRPPARATPTSCCAPSWWAASPS